MDGVPDELLEQALRYQHDVGFDEGYEEGYEEGRAAGYEEGLLDALVGVKSKTEVQ